MPDQTPQNGRRLTGFCDPEFQARRWTPEARERQREVIRRRIAEGTFGGPENARKGALTTNRRRRQLAQEAIAEYVAEEKEAIVRVYDELLHHKSPHVRLKALKQLMEHESWATANQREDEKELLKLSDSELDQALRQELAEALGFDPLDDAVEGDAEEIPALETGDGDGD